MRENVRRLQGWRSFTSVNPMPYNFEIQSFRRLFSRSIVLLAVTFSLSWLQNLLESHFSGLEHLKNSIAIPG